ncbi:hypothetical protein JAAARDRAFT_33951 [Jaapia argillacea MUCL 33604]|uniref:RRM domain-containing protein n=1 Tax=Jaapia argillacea MUCL 33604 TaxID=933084 RepID=A0A067PZ97_9AGAM|nr:hypothetical protein JAAARDRAFT_33951 [Jaapia argillacea MUCL 33604]
MDELPTAPSGRPDDERSRPGDRNFGRRDDFASSRQDRGPPREDLPLPTQPPYTAFIGNLAFDLTEGELADFFGSAKTKSVKIIKDRDEKPKGFGYVEFVDLVDLKDALAKTGSSIGGRTIRVSVAEPPKERAGFGGGDDDTKFANPWRRDGPLPDIPDSRDSSRRRVDSQADRPSAVSDSAAAWRSSRPARLSTGEADAPSFKRRGSGFLAGDGGPGAAESEDHWAIGSKFKPSAEEGGGSRFGSLRGRGDMAPPRESPTHQEDNDWRTSSRPRPITRNSSSPTNSTPPTPQMGRRKLELLPRSAGASATPSPLSSPKAASGTSSARSNPFGAAKPVDVSARESAVTDRLEKEREATRERVSHPMSRTNSRTPLSRTSSHTPSERNASNRVKTPPPVTTPTTPPATVRPTISFASAAGGKKESSNAVRDDGEKVDKLNEEKNSV